MLLLFCSLELSSAAVIITSSHINQLWRSYKKKNQYLNSSARLRFLNSNKLLSDGRPHQSGMISPTSKRIVWWAAKRLVCLFVLLCFLLVLEFIIKHDHTLPESLYKARYLRNKEKILTGCEGTFRYLMVYSLTTFLTLTLTAFGGDIIQRNMKCKW